MKIKEMQNKVKNIFLAQYPTVEIKMDAPNEKFKPEFITSKGKEVVKLTNTNNQHLQNRKTVKATAR